MISLVGLESPNTLFEVTTVGDFSTKKKTSIYPHNDFLKHNSLALDTPQSDILGTHFSISQSDPDLQSFPPQANIILPAETEG